MFRPGANTKLAALIPDRQERGGGGEGGGGRKKQRDEEEGGPVNEKQVTACEIVLSFMESFFIQFLHSLFNSEDFHIHKTTQLILHH